MLEPMQDPILQAGLVDLDATLLIQLGIFVVFALALNALVVQPIARTQQARFARMQGARREAEEMDLRAAEAYRAYESRLEAARRDAFAVRDAMVTEAEAEAADRLATVREEADRTRRAGRQVLEERRTEARREMEPVVEELASAIADRVLEREGAA